MSSLKLFKRLAIVKIIYIGLKCIGLTPQGLRGPLFGPSKLPRGSSFCAWREPVRIAELEHPSPKAWSAIKHIAESSG